MKRFVSGYIFAVPAYYPAYKLTSFADFGDTLLANKIKYLFKSDLDQSYRLVVFIKL